MQPYTSEQVRKQMAELRALLESVQQLAQPVQNTNSSLSSLEAHILVSQLSGFLQKFHRDNLDSHNANNTWLQQIDRNVKIISQKIDEISARLPKEAGLSVLIMVAAPWITRSWRG
jgi:hypothetical protein